MTGITPTRPVSIATLVAALVGIAVWILDAGAGVTITVEVTGAITTLIVGVVAWRTASAKVAAGTLASALVTVLIFALDTADVHVPPDTATLLTTVALFVFAWSASERTDDGIDPHGGF